MLCFFNTLSVSPIRVVFGDLPNKCLNGRPCEVVVAHRGGYLHSRPQTCTSRTCICLSCLTCTCYWIVGFLAHACRVEDYWEGYKLFCYAYYSHSAQHESEFQQSKLGTLFAPSFRFVAFLVLSLPCLCACGGRFLASFSLTAAMFVFAKGNLFGGGMLFRLLLPIVYSALPACRSFLLSRCSAGGSCKKIAAISVP
jgi:hypothetical protein